MSEGINLKYQPSGETLVRFMNSQERVRAIMGPIGSGKTICALFQCIYRTIQQHPSRIDGVKRGKFAVIRDTIRNLERTTIPSWHKWVPPSVGNFTGGKHGEPAKHQIRLNWDGQVLDILIEFIGIGDNAVEEVMRGWEGTGAYLNEADTLSPDVLDFVNGRLGRYPDISSHGHEDNWNGVWLDFNAPNEDNYIYRRFFEEKPDNFELFIQPGGRDPNAENLENLPRGYYEQAAAGAEEWYVRRMIDNKIGYSREGKPVYPEFDPRVHSVEGDLTPNPMLPIVVGADAGRTPAAIFMQQQTNGIWFILDELIGEGVGGKRFGEDLGRFAADRFPNHPIHTGRQGDARARNEEDAIQGWADPAARFAGDLDEFSWIDQVSAASGIRFRPAPGNNSLTERLECVRQPMSLMIDGKPGLILSGRCKALRAGFISGYKYKKVGTVGGDGHVRYHETPDKNQHSHPQDALQCGMLGGGGYAAVKRREKRDHRGGRPGKAKSAYGGGRGR